MTEKRLSTFHIVFAIVLITAGLAVFVIRLLHPGPYAMPHSGALYGALGSFILAGIMLLSQFGLF